MSKTQGLYPDTFYHIYNRVNNRENIYVEERNYRYFLERYAQYIEPVAATYAYCLLRNHFHFLVRIRSVGEQEEMWNRESQTCGVSETPQVFVAREPSRQFSNLFNTYTKAINKAYGRTGSLFEGRFKRRPVESQADLIQLVRYIHRNPERHGFVDDYREWPYSSYQALVSERPTRTQREEVLDWFQGRRAFEDAHIFEDETAIEYLVLDDYF